MDTSTKTLLSLPKRALAVVAAVALAASMAFTGAQAFAFPADAPAGPYTVTVHKFGTGSESSTGGTGEEVADENGLGTPLQGVTFKLTQLKTDMVEALAVNGTVPSDAITTIEDNLTTYEATPGVNGTTDAQGKYTWSIDANAQGYYLLQETNLGANTEYTMGKSSIIAVPMVKVGGDATVEGDWLKNIHVYPKNVKEVMEGQVTKTQESGKESDLNEGDQIQYALNIGVHEGADLASDPSYALYTATDLLPRDKQGNPVLDLNDWSLKVVAGGADVTATVFPNDKATYFALAAQDTSEMAAPVLPDNTNGENGVGYGQTAGSKTAFTWKTNDEFAKAIKAWNDANGGNKIKVVSIVINTTVNANVKNLEPVAGGTLEIENNGAYWFKKADGTTGGGEIDPPPAGSVSGFGFEKVDGDVKDTKLEGAVFQLTTADGKVLTRDGATAITSTSEAGTGHVSFGDLSKINSLKIQNEVDWWNDIHNAVEAAKASPNTPQKVTLGIQETKAPNGYQLHHELIKFTLVATSVDGKNVTFSLEKSDGTAVGGATLMVDNFKPGSTGGSLIQLPNTGGMGAALIVLAGAAAIGGAAYINRRNKKAAEKDVF